ncbi:DsbA family protein [Schaalia sp. lx-100]|uniref:DsbA family protein n=1 Tax=Schaalia sp. lx-100 TaxID=2899081 RepID=UPI001E353649|nr:thioredoxin domain-containing protein [Schaalia sp. lx-100]MCD4556824.1 DsbA family protein [Schaalia sp. lx-100]
MTLPNSPTVSTASPRSERNPLVLIMALLLLIVATLLIVVTVILVRDRSLAQPPQSAVEMTQSEAGSPTAQKPQSTQTQAQTSHEEVAPAHTDSEALAIIRAEPHRDPTDGQAKGSVDAPVVLVLYSDFGCPYCTLFAKEIQPQLNDLIDNGTLRVEWRDLAQVTQTSPLAAQAGRAAASQGRFWEFHDAVYAAAGPSEHPEYTESKLIDFARAAGVPDIEAFTAEMTSQATVQAVQKSREHAYSIGVKGTPFAFIGDSVISGYRDIAYIRNTITEYAKQAAR